MGRGDSGAAAPPPLIRGRSSGAARSTGDERREHECPTMCMGTYSRSATTASRGAAAEVPQVRGRWQCVDTPRAGRGVTARASVSWDARVSRRRGL